MPEAAYGFPPVFDALRPVGRIAETLRPWFYERLLRRPRGLRQRYLDALRTMSAAGELPQSFALGGGKATSLTVDALVVGGGPGGMGAAEALATVGRSVVVVEADELGGSWLSQRSRRSELARRKAALQLLNVRVLEYTTCLGLYDEEGIAGAVGPQGPVEITYDSLVLATGAYDRPLLFSGNDLPGVIGLRGFEAFCAQQAFTSGSRIGVFGGPAEVERALTRAAEEDVELSWIAGPGELPPSSIPLFPNRQLVRARGRGGLTAVELDNGTRLACEFLVLGFSQPTWELAVQSGAEARVAGMPPIVVAQPGPDSGTIVVGEAAGHLDPGTVANDAEERVLAWLSGMPSEVAVADLGRDPSAVSPEAFVCFCEDVRVRDVQAAIAAGFTQTELLKRRTGVSTGPCQGKLCMAPFLDLVGSLDLPPSLPTARPPVRPVTLASLVVTDD